MRKAIRMKYRFSMRNIRGIDKMNIRTARIEDVKQFAEIGYACYPVEETITEEEYRKRVDVYPNHFWVLETQGEIVAFVNGPVTDSPCIFDEMYHNANVHKENGKWQAILGLNTSPDYQKKGYASKLMNQLIKDAKQQG